MEKGIGFDPKYLGKHVEAPAGVLDVIPWLCPPQDSTFAVTIECSEFSSFCPVTGAPDFGHLLIEYVPDQLLVETKSLKLFLWGYRERRAFNEVIVEEIAQRFFEQVRPHWVNVKGTFNSRGGLSVTACASRHRPPEGLPLTERPVLLQEAKL